MFMPNLGQGSGAFPQRQISEAALVLNGKSVGLNSLGVDRCVRLADTHDGPLDGRKVRLQRRDSHGSVKYHAVAPSKRFTVMSVYGPMLDGKPVTK
jgi:hypothetical protein